MRIWATGLLAFFLLLAGAGPPAQAQPTAESVSRQVHESVARVQAGLGLAVDPAVTGEMAASAAIFVANFCSSLTCQAMVGTPAVLDPLVRDHLADLATRRPASVQALGARLARAAGGTMAQAGWPEEVDNSAAVVELPAALQTGRIELQTATGLVPIGTNARLLLLAPGPHALRIVGPDGAVTERRVDLTPRARLALGNGQAGPGAATLGRIAFPASMLCRNEAAVSFQGPYALFNWGRRQFGDEASRIANLTPFASQTGLEIQVREQVRGTCDQNCVTSLGIAFAQAVALWRSTCDRCSKNALAVIKVGNNVWIDARAAERLRLFASGALPMADLDLSRLRLGEAERYFSGASFSTINLQLIDYVPASSDPTLARAACTLDARVPWGDAAKAALCSAGPMPGGLHPAVSLMTGATSCGPAEDFIACGTPGGGIELSLADGAFAISTPTGRAIIGQAGAPAMEIVPVIVHEVGHWFGVPHAEVAGASAVVDIMGQTYEPARACVSTSSLIMLNNAADGRWPFRAGGTLGLRRPARSRP